MKTSRIALQPSLLEHRLEMSDTDCAVVVDYLRTRNSFLRSQKCLQGSVRLAGHTHFIIPRITCPSKSSYIPKLLSSYHLHPKATIELVCDHGQVMRCDFGVLIGLLTANVMRISSSPTHFRINTRA